MQIALSFYRDIGIEERFFKNIYFSTMVLILKFDIEEVTLRTACASLTGKEESLCYFWILFSVAAIEFGPKLW